jgi:PhzF family phenazine biosynthesis protein
MLSFAAMGVPYYQVNSFTRDVRRGNPAGVCLMPRWPGAREMQRIAASLPLPEVAFTVPDEKQLRIRWFTPIVEMDLCGHATLAAAHVLFAHRGFDGKQLEFKYTGGDLTITRAGQQYEMDFPSRPAKPVDSPAGLISALGAAPEQVFKARDLLAVFDDEKFVREMTPDFRALRMLNVHGVIVTAPAKDTHFVSRFFAPAVGVDEDHVTGSAHCTLTPYWAARLKKKVLTAEQASPRGGELECELRGDRVLLRGHAVTVIQGELA